MPVLAPPVRSAPLRNATYPVPSNLCIVVAALCLFTALVSGYLCLTQSVVTRSANISHSAVISSFKDGHALVLSSRQLSEDDKSIAFGFDGFIWIGSRAIPRIIIDTSTAITEIRIANQLIKPLCHDQEGRGGDLRSFHCEVDLSGLRCNHVQRLVVALSGNRAPFTMVIEPFAGSRAALLLGSIALIATLVSVLMLSRAAHQSWTIGAIGALGFGVRLIYWAKTPPLVRTHDGYAHVQYVTLVALNWIRPDRSVGWETHQAPLYYYIGAVIVSVTRFLGFSSLGAALAALQALSLLFSVLTAVVAFLCMKAWGEAFCPDEALRERAVAMAIALYVFWPAVVMDSVRIGNDSLLLFLAVIFLFFILRWHSRQSASALIAASVTAAFAIATKASGLALLPVLLLAAGIEWRSRPNKREIYKHLLWLVPVLALAGFITFGSGLRERIAGRDTSLLLAKNIPSSAFVVGNRPGNYLWFNPKKFVATPFTDLFNDDYGRQSFWHYFWKTSLVGEFRSTSRLERLCASSLSGLLLLLLSLMLFSIFFCRAERWRPLASSISFAVFWISGTVAFSILLPFASNRDFRYAAPALTCICWFAAFSSSSFVLNGRLRIARCADIILVSFIVCSIGFALGLPSYP